jgi:S-DNA-T family DNA segregation ATPase FtsK/SpoIIIE
VASTPEDVVRLLRGVPVGITETGGVWRVRLHGVHVLFAGTTGSGKSSLLWALMHGLADPVTKGLVQVTWLDPKGGMDATPARPMAHVIDRVPEMADTLDHLVAELDTRAAHLAATGARGHVPSVASPHRVVVVDELATLTALADPKTARRVEAALGALTSRGRGPGYTVVLTTVEPTKEVVRWRGLCAERVAFRLDEPSQVDMVLGDGALHRGAACPTIPTDTPGVCYVRPDGTPDPTRARVTWLSNSDITALTRAYPAPVTTPGTGTGAGSGEHGGQAAA